MDAGPVTSETFLQVVGEPQRWQLLQHLVDGDLKVSEMVARTGRAQNAVSYHLRELREAGLVSSHRSAADGRDAYYRIHLDRFAALVGGAAAALDPSLRVTSAPPSWPRSGRGRRARVLFLCTGNSARSQIAEALTEHHSQGAVRAASAGSHPKPLHPDAVRVLAERGIDISGHRSKPIESVARTRFDRVVTLCDKVKEVCADRPDLTPTAHWSVTDPAAGGGTDAETRAAFDAVADEIDGRVRLLLSRVHTHPTPEVSHAQR